jgi:uncharacterized SAM-binding protein YcdF (DUF218 family)
VNAKGKRWLRIAAALTVSTVLAVPLAWLAAPRFLLIDTGIPSGLLASSASGEAVSVGAGESKAIALVVLGGEPWTRPQRGAEVYAEVHPSLVLVSGEGDCEDVRRQLEARNVPAAIIVTECLSASTYQNARFSVELLRKHHVTQAVIVTSWYHSRRAAACFREAAPEIMFYSRPTLQPPSRSYWPNRYERDRILREYGKILYYWVVYGVNPFAA